MRYAGNMIVVFEKPPSVSKASTRRNRKLIGSLSQPVQGSMRGEPSGERGKRRTGT